MSDIPETIYKIDVVGNAPDGITKIARVVREPPKERFVQNKDNVRFVASDPRTVIKYLGTTPFKATIRADKEFSLKGQAETRFLCENVGNHVFECGEIVNGKFVRWITITGGNSGDTTPVDGDPGGQ